MIVSSLKYNVQEYIKSSYETKMTMTVKKFEKDDVGSYRCIAKNSLGEVDSSIRLYGESNLKANFVIKKFNMCVCHITYRNSRAHSKSSTEAHHAR